MEIKFVSFFSPLDMCCLNFCTGDIAILRLMLKPSG